MRLIRLQSVLCAFALLGLTSKTHSQDSLQLHDISRMRVGGFCLPTDKFSEKTAAELNHLIRENLKRNSKLIAIGVRTLVEENNTDPTLIALKQARSIFARGKSLYSSLELQAAIPKLIKAVEWFEKAANRLGNGEEYFDALLTLGSAYILSGDNESGIDRFRLVAGYDPRHELNPKDFSPSMIKIFERIKEEILALPKGSLLVEADPPAAEVYLDGQYRGIAPLIVKNITEGSHFIRVEKDGYIPWAKPIQIVAIREEALGARLLKAPGFDSFSQITSQLLEVFDEDPPGMAMIRLGEWLGLDRLMLAKVRVRGSELETEAVVIQIYPAKRFESKSATFSISETGFMNKVDDFFSSLHRKDKPSIVVEKDRKVVSLPVSVSQCNSDSDCNLGEVCDEESGRCVLNIRKEQYYKQWWFWAVIGGGLAVATGATVLIWYLNQPNEGAIEFRF